MKPSQEDLRKYLETWIQVASIFLALQLALITFTVGIFLDHGLNTNIFLYLSYAMVVPAGAALAVFIGARDPRQKHFSTQTLIDIGIRLAFGSAYMMTFVLSYGIYFVSKDFTFSIIVLSSMLIGISVILFSYKKYIYESKGKNDAERKEKSL